MKIIDRRYGIEYTIKPASIISAYPNIVEHQRSIFKWIRPAFGWIALSNGTYLQVDWATYKDVSEKLENGEL